MTNIELMLQVQGLKKKLDAYTKKQVVISDKIDELLPNYTFNCGECKQESKIGDATFIEHYWYESPYGCTGGDNWWLSENAAYIECPNCKSRLRIFKPNHDALLSKKKYFKEIISKE